jgi:hypothetical protein
MRTLRAQIIVAVILSVLTLLSCFPAQAQFTKFSEILEKEVGDAIEGKKKSDTSFTLKVTTMTGEGLMLPEAGEIRVYLSLNGDPNYEKQLTPQGGFKVGATDNFDLEFDMSLEEIHSIVVRVTGEGGWLCEQISFQFIKGNQTSQLYSFDSYMWFAGKESKLNKFGTIPEKRFIFTPSFEKGDLPPQPAEGPLSILVKQEMTRPPGEEYLFLQGAPARIILLLKNTSDDFIVVRSVSIPGQLPDTDKWYGSQYGSTNYRELDDTWVYNEMQQMLSDPVFAFGVIGPGESLEVLRWCILREKKLPVKIAYQRLTKTQAGKYLYFHTYHEGEFSAKRIFERCSDIDELSSAEKKVDWRVIIAPEIKSVPMITQQALCSVSLRESDFSFEQARKSIGSEASDYVFWPDENMWIISAEKGAYLVGPEVVTELPRIDLLSFIIIASSNETVPVIFPLSGYEVFNPQKPHIEGPGYFNPGVTQLPKHKLSTFFEGVKKAGDAISVLHYNPDGLGVQRYLLVGEFNETVRRNLARKKEIE